MDYLNRFEAIQAEGKEIFIRKNRDYGNSFAEDGVLGVMIRMKDKLNRFITLARKDGEAACKDEALRDTLIDLHNYAAMAVICHEEGKPWEPHSPTQPRTPSLGSAPDKDNHQTEAL